MLQRTASGLPEAVEAYIASHIRTIEDLQLLVTLVEDPGRWWDVASIVREQHVSKRTARMMLEHLAARNLLEIRLTADVRYRFCPGTSDLRAVTLACVETYLARPRDVERWIAALGRRSVRDSADAFRVTNDSRTHEC